MVLQSSLPFSAGASTSIAVTGASGNAALPGYSYPQQVEVNSPSGNAIAFIKFGVGSGTVAALTDIPILPGTVQVFTPSPGVTHVAAIGTAGSTVYFTVGIGH